MTIAQIDSLVQARIRQQPRKQREWGSVADLMSIGRVRKIPESVSA